MSIEICILDNGIPLQMQRTWQSLNTQTDQSFIIRVIDMEIFWDKKRCLIPCEGEYVLFLYSGSILLPDAIAKLNQAIGRQPAPWYYFDEEIFDSQLESFLWKKEKPDFSLFNIAGSPYTGEGVLFSRELLQGMDLSYRGTNFYVAILEITLTAASNCDGIHIPQLLLQHNARPKPLQDETVLLSRSAQQMLKMRKTTICSIIRSDVPGLRFYPPDTKKCSVSVILLGNAETSPIPQSCQIIHQHDGSSYWDNCKAAVEKATGDLLCFVTTNYSAMGRMEWERLQAYATMPDVGMISPCLRDAEKIYYAGVFSIAGVPFCLKSQENDDLVYEDRETVLPAEHFWVIRRELMDKLDISMSSSSHHGIFHLAALCRQMGKRNLYVGTIAAYCDKPLAIRDFSCFPSDLLWYRRYYFMDTLCPAPLKAIMHQQVLKNTKAYFPDDMSPFSPEEKSIFVLSHELSLTGAPLVLVQAVKILRQNGWQVVVASPKDGAVAHDFIHLGAPVLILEDMDQSDTWLQMALAFDLVLVNTIVPFKLIHQLGEHDVPVLWWLHDARCGYRDYLQYVLPETIGNNIHIYSVSHYAKKAVTDFRPKYSSKLMHYGLDDEASKFQNRENPFSENERAVFLNIGTVIPRKGQDILAEAIRKLPDELRKQCQFQFIGKVFDEDMNQLLCQLKKDFPKEIELVGEIPHDDVMCLYAHATAVICSSRDDPLPTFMTENMMMSGICICSENTGTAALIENGKNGYVYHNDDPDELAECICQVLAHKDMKSLRQEARKTYESVFSREVFEQNILRSVAECIAKLE